MLIIDSHAHIGFSHKQYPLYVRTLEKMIEVMDRFEINKACVSSLKAIQYDFIEGNRELKEQVAKFPERFVPFCVIHPRDWDYAKDELVKCIEERLQATRYGTEMPELTERTEPDHDLRELAGEVSSCKDLVNFILELCDDLRKKRSEWANYRSECFLDASARWLNSQDEEMPEPPTWSTLAHILAAAKYHK